MRAKTKRLWVGMLLAFALLALALVAQHFSIPRGRLDTVAYHSEAVGGTRQMVVYLPPSYPNDGPYPVLYLLHGAGGDETSWTRQGSAHAILDRLLADRSIPRMIVVMPNAQGRGSSFEHELLHEVIPQVESRYATRCDGTNRAIAGLSLGGGQALAIGLKHPDRFAWIGAFSPSLTRRTESEVLGDPASWRGRIKLLWLSCGDTDPLRSVSESLHQALEAQEVPHLWRSGSGEHEWAVWKNDLRQFAPLLFRAETGSAPADLDR